MHFCNSTSRVLQARKQHGLLVSNMLEIKLTLTSEERSKANVCVFIKGVRGAKYQTTTKLHNSCIKRVKCNPFSSKVIGLR